MKPRIAVGLIHWPVYDKAGNSVCTNVTNFDIHDIARMSRSYGIETYFVINRMREQLMFVERILDHWRTGEGAHYNPSRREALMSTRTAETLQHALELWGAPNPIVIGTSAKKRGPGSLVTFKGLREQWQKETEDDNPPKSYFLVFGTGYGLGAEFDEHCQHWLEPIKPVLPTGFLHLSVRSAVSICLDRLLGAW